jgi:hypothetical protein
MGSPYNTYDGSSHSYMAPIFNAMHGGRTASPAGAPTSPPQTGSSERRQEAPTLQPAPHNQAQMRATGSAQIRVLQQNRSLPKPELAPAPASGAAALLQHALQWFRLSAFAAASEVPQPSCSAQGECDQKAALPSPPSAAKAKTGAAAAGEGEGASAFDLLDLLREDPAVQVALSPALKQAGARLAGSWMLVAWDVLPPETVVKLKRLATAPNDRMILCPQHSAPPGLRGKRVETLPLNPDIKMNQKRLSIAIIKIHAFVGSLKAGILPDVESLRQKGFFDAMNTIQAAISRIGSDNLSADVRSELDFLKQAVDMEYGALGTSLDAQSSQDLDSLQQRMKQAPAGLGMIFCTAKQVEKLATPNMPDGRISVISPPHMDLSSGLRGGYRRSLDYLIGLAGKDYEIELSPQLRGKKNLRLDGLLIVWPDHWHNDIEAHQRRNQLVTQVFDAAHDQFLLEQPLNKALDCMGVWAVPPGHCKGIDHPESVEKLQILISRLEDLVHAVAQQIRAAGLGGLPDDRDLTVMGTDAAIIAIKSHLASGKAALHPKKEDWTWQLNQANSHMLDKVQELNLVREAFALDRVEQFFKPEDANHLDQGSGHLANLRDKYFAKFPTVILHDIRSRENFRKIQAQASN